MTPMKVLAYLTVVTFTILYFCWMLVPVEQPKEVLPQVIIPTASPSHR